MTEASYQPEGPRLLDWMDHWDIETRTASCAVFIFLQQSAYQSQSPVPVTRNPFRQTAPRPIRIVQTDGSHHDAADVEDDAECVIMRGNGIEVEQDLQ